jgi:hypothetical protein
MSSPERWLRFVQIDPFPRQWEQLGLDDRALRALEQEIVAGPDAAPVVKGTGGIRKLRFSAPGARRGKSGAYRVFYLHLPEHGTVLELAIIAKTKQADLTEQDRNVLSQVVARLRRMLDAGAIG